MSFTVLSMLIQSLLVLCVSLLRCYEWIIIPSTQAEVWDLDVLRANNVSWPVDDSELKDGLIVVKGHTQVVHRLRSSLEARLFTVRLCFLFLYPT